MLSYRHGFHAGNHADVLKHWVLLQCAEYLGKKDKPWCYIDTHSGAGSYRLDSEFASKNAEHQSGIDRLLAAEKLPESLQTLLTQVAMQPRADSYPGSPLLAQSQMRAQDKAFLYELHPADFRQLDKLFRADSRFKIAQQDGLQGLKAQLPPASRRGLILIDPSYEIKSDYKAVVEAVKQGLKRFSSGVYCIWYPMLPRHESRDLPQQLQHLHDRWLDIRLQVTQPVAQGGMYGSGMFVINPPWILQQNAPEVLPWLAATLAQDNSAHYVLNQSEQL